MTIPKLLPSTIVMLILVQGCVTVPSGPSVMALPGTGKSFEQFHYDDEQCLKYARARTGTTEQASVQSGVQSAAIGTAVGALAGAAISGSSRGAGVGAGAGLLFGSVAGSDASRSSAHGTQRQFDNAYVQCMYAQGHRVPIPGGLTQAKDRPFGAPAPYAGNPDYVVPQGNTSARITPPAPPPGNPPAPPPGF